MKYFLTCALCFVSLPVLADVTVYYDKKGNCPGFRLAADCSSTQVTKLSVTTKPDRDTGYYVNGNLIVDYAGNVAVNALENLRNANLSGAITVPQNNTCMSGATKNNKGTCVRDDTSYVQIDPSTGISINVDDFVYDFEGAREFALDKDTVSDTGKSGNTQRTYYEFDVVLHWCPPSYGNFSWTWHDGASASAGTPPVPQWDGILNTACAKPPVTLHYKWPTDSAGGHPHVPALANSVDNYYYDDPGAAGYYYNNARVYCIDVKNQRVITNKAECKFGTYSGEHYTPGENTHNYLDSNNDNGGVDPQDKWVFRGFFILPEIGEPPTNCPEDTTFIDVGTSQSGHDNITGPSSVAESCIIYWANRNTLAKRYVTNKTERSARARLSATANHPYIIDVTDTRPGTDSTDSAHNYNIYSYWNTRWGILSETAIPTDYKVHLYGSWARMCQDISDGSCSLYIGYGANTGTIDDIEYFWWARDGSVTYTTSCYSGTPQVAVDDRYLETGTPSDGTYYPICKSQGNRRLLYIDDPNQCWVKDTDTSVGRVAWTCTPNQSFNLLTSNDIDCTNNFEPNGLIIDKVIKHGSINVNTSVKKELGDEVMCNNNDLGIADQVNIRLSTCAKCEVNLTHHIVNCIERDDGCKEIECEEGYNLYKTEDGVYECGQVSR